MSPWMTTNASSGYIGTCFDSSSGMLLAMPQTRRTHRERGKLSSPCGMSSRHQGTDTSICTVRSFLGGIPSRVSNTNNLYVTARAYLCQHLNVSLNPITSAQVMSTKRARARSLYTQPVSSEVSPANRPRLEEEGLLRVSIRDGHLPAHRRGKFVYLRKTGRVANFDESGHTQAKFERWSLRARVHVRTALRTALWSLRRLPSACTAQSWPHLWETAAALPCRFVSGSVSHALSHCTHLYSAHPFHGQPHWHVENRHSSSLSTARIDTAGKRGEAGKYTQERQSAHMQRTIIMASEDASGPNLGPPCP